MRSLLSVVLRPLLRAWRRQQYKRNMRQYWTDRDFMKDTFETQERAEVHRQETDFLTERILGLEPQRVLDVGCSFGAVVKAVAERGVEQVVGMDISPTGLAQARSHVGTLSNTALLEAGVEHLPFADNSFDVVLTRSVVAHLPPKVADRGRREMARVSRGYVLHLENETTAGRQAHTYLHDNGAAYQAMGFERVAREPGPMRQQSTFTCVDVRSGAAAD